MEARQLKKYCIDNMDLSEIPLSFPNSLIMVCQDYPDTETAEMPRGIFIALSDPTHGWAHRYDLIELHPFHDGKPLPIETVATPAGLVATCAQGKIELCFDGNKTVRLQTEGDFSLRFFIRFRRFEQFIDHCDGSLVASFRPLAGEFLFEALTGKQTYESGLVPEESRSADTAVWWTPEGGKIEGYLSFNEHDVERRGFTRSIEQCFEENMADFKAFYAKTYKLPYEKIRDPYEVSAYMIWCSCMHDYLTVTGYAISMAKGGNMRYAKGWHQAMQGMAAWRNLDLALELIYQIPGKADEYGMAAGGVNTIGAQYRNPMPPIEGWALTYVVKRHGGWDCISLEWAQKLYDALSRIAGWWREFSDVDGDGIIGYTNSDSSGWNDATMFAGGMPTVCPDISAWMILETEALGNLARRLGRESDAAYWLECSRHMLDDMVNTLWDGEKFIVKNELTGETVMNHCIALYQVVMLGKRLPQHIIDKLVETLKDTSKFLAPTGFTTEAMDSPYYDVIHQAMMHGRIFAMANFYVIYGLYACGAKEFAKERAKIWAEEMVEFGPQTIVPGPKQTWEPMPFEAPVFDCLPSKLTPAKLSTWGCGVMLNIADMLNDDFDC